MIKMLQNWLEVREANKFLNANTLPTHGHNIEKNWDLCQLYSIVRLISKEAKIIDLGCGNLFALKLLHAAGFKDLYGIDLSVPLRNRLSQIYIMCKSRSLRLPFHLYRGDLTKTNFAGAMFDLAICISVIEHGVDIENFFLEAHRLLKPGGILFITTDYWEEKINVMRDNKPLGLPWKIFCKRDLEGIIAQANKFNFSLYDNSIIPTCSDKCIIWNNQEYTFLELVFKRGLQKHLF